MKVSRKVRAVRQEPEFFGDQELVLVFVAKRLKQALALEQVFDAGQLDYAVIPTRYTGGLLFPSERVGAFFYVAPQAAVRARTLMLESGFTPCEENREG